MTEFNLQVFTTQYLKLNAGADVVWYAVPNGESRSARTGAKLKRMGVRAGVFDFALVLPGGQAAFLELKTSKGRLSSAQKVFQGNAQRAGALTAVCANADAVMAVLKGWGAIKDNSKPVARRTAA